MLLEHYRSTSRSDSLDEEGQPKSGHGAGRPGSGFRPAVEDQGAGDLLDLPEKDRLLLKAVFLDERDRDEVCREFGVDREYLRVLLFRAKQEFKTEYIKRIGTGVTAKRA